MEQKPADRPIRESSIYELTELETIPWTYGHYRVTGKRNFHENVNVFAWSINWALCVRQNWKAGWSMSGQVTFAAKTLDRADTSSLIAQQTDGIFIIDCIQSLNYNSYKIYIYIYYKLYKLRRWLVHASWPGKVLSDMGET